MRDQYTTRVPKHKLEAMAARKAALEAVQNRGRPTPETKTVTLEDQGVERPDEPKRPDWMLDSSPYEYHGRERPKHFRSKGKRFDPWSGKRQPDTSADLRQWLYDYKRHNGCCVCGEDEPECLHFHHRNPESKEAAVSSLIGRGRTLVLAEIAKCDLLCANCHAKVHAGILVREKPHRQG